MDVTLQFGQDPLDVRRVNFYGKTERNLTPYGQVVEDNIIHELVDELEASSEYRARRTPAHRTSRAIRLGRNRIVHAAHDRFLGCDRAG